MRKGSSSRARGYGAGRFYKPRRYSLKRQRQHFALVTMKFIDFNPRATSRDMPNTLATSAILGFGLVEKNLWGQQ